MSRSLLVILAATWTQAILTQPAAYPQEPLTPTPVVQSTQPIPFRMLQQIVHGRDMQKQFRVEIPPEQIAAMKKVQADRSQRDSEISGLSGKLSMSPFTNRRLRTAAVLMAKENEDELHAEWLRLITPEQQSLLRRRNRQTIFQASLESQQVDRSLQSSQESIDQLINNEDYLSIVEQPWIQDLIEITDEQLTQIEEQKKLAQEDAFNTLRQFLELVESQQAAAKTEARPQPVQSDARKQLQERTMKVLSPEQTEMYRKLLSDPNRVHKLVSNSSPPDPQDRFLLLVPHGAARSTRTEVKDGQTKITIVLHNAFERPELIKELSLSDAQQKEIATILDELRPKITSEMEAEHIASQERERKKREARDQLLKTHIAKFSTPVLAILTEDQKATLQKERFRGLGLPALSKPQVKATLKLTEEQSRLIAEIQSRRAPQYDMPEFAPTTAPVSTEEFRKRSEEFHKRAQENGQKMREFMDRQSEDIAAVLTDEQRAAFCEMTGYRFPRDRGVKVPAISL